MNRGRDRQSEGGREKARQGTTLVLYMTLVLASFTYLRCYDSNICPQLIICIVYIIPLMF